MRREFPKDVPALTSPISGPDSAKPRRKAGLNVPFAYSGGRKQTDLLQPHALNHHALLPLEFFRSQAGTDGKLNALDLSDVEWNSGSEWISNWEGSPAKA